MVDCVISSREVYEDYAGDFSVSKPSSMCWVRFNTWAVPVALNRLRSQVGRSRVNMLKWGFSNEQETCDCGIRQTMQHLLVCPMMDTACSPQDLATANGIAIGCAKHWEGTIWRTYDSWWKDKNDDDMTYKISWYLAGDVIPRNKWRAI